MDVWLCMCDRDSAKENYFMSGGGAGKVAGGTLTDTSGMEVSSFFCLAFPPLFSISLSKAGSFWNSDTGFFLACIETSCTFPLLPVKNSLKFSVFSL